MPARLAGKDHQPGPKAIDAMRHQSAVLPPTQFIRSATIVRSIAVGATAPARYPPMPKVWPTGHAACRKTPRGHFSSTPPASIATPAGRSRPPLTFVRGDLPLADCRRDSSQRHRDFLYSPGGRKIQLDRPISARWKQTFHAESECGPVPVESEVDDLASEPLRFSQEQLLGQQRGSISAAGRTPGRIAADALLELTALGARIR
jgi:hypothetical protein